MDFKEFKRFCMFNMIGSLIIAALVAVISILIGDFSEVLARVIGTLGLVILHSLVSLAFLWDNDKRGTFDKFSFFSNTIFVLIVLSFLTSVFGVWQLISENIWEKAYLSFGVIAFAALHMNILGKALDKEKFLDMTVFANYALILVVVLMLQPVIFMDNVIQQLGEFYVRLLGASAVIDGTLSILVIIFYKLYMNKHPRIQDDLSEKKKGLSVWVWILIIYLILQVVFPVLGFFVFRIF